MRKPTTPLRQRMIEDMAIRNMSPLTQAAYVRAVANFAIHHGVSPDKLTFEDVRKYQVHLIGRGLKVATIIPIMCALRFLYGTTLGLKDVSDQIPLPRKEDTLPTVLSRDAYQNKAKVYGLLFTAAAETLTTIADDPKHLGARISPGGERWVSSRHNFFLSVRVLSRLFRRLFLEGLERLHLEGELQFFNDLAPLKDMAQFRARLVPLRRSEWVVYAKRPFAGPEQVLAYLARYTHRVAIGNSRLASIDDGTVAFRWKDYRQDGAQQKKVMRLDAGEFMRRFLMHVLPDGLHRIRHYGLFANGHRAEKLALCRKLLNVPVVPRVEDDASRAEAEIDERPPCPCCGGHMRLIETFERGTTPRSSIIVMRFDTS
jgi:hypothetical protein